MRLGSDSTFFGFVGVAEKAAKAVGLTPGAALYLTQTLQDSIAADFFDSRFPYAVDTMLEAERESNGRKRLELLHSRARQLLVYTGAFRMTLGARARRKAAPSYQYYVNFGQQLYDLCGAMCGIGAAYGITITGRQVDVPAKQLFSEMAAYLPDVSDALWDEFRETANGERSGLDDMLSDLQTIYGSGLGPDDILRDLP